MEPRTHYQISLTARQAVGLFVGFLLALGLAFFFGLMAGLTGRDRARPAPETVASAAPRTSASAEALPPVETAVPTRREAAAARAKGAPEEIAAVPAVEPTAPATLQTFEDGGGAETAAAPTAPLAPAKSAPAKPASSAQAKPASSAPAKPATAKAASVGRVWVQVASVSSRSEADAASARLSQHGYKTLILSDKGRFRLRVGPYRTTEDARRAAEKLHQQEKIKSPWVVFEGK